MTAFQDRVPTDGTWKRIKQRHNQELKKLILTTLASNNQHRINTANELGVSRVHLYNRMIEFGIIEKKSSK